MSERACGKVHPYNDLIVCGQSRRHVGQHKGLWCGQSVCWTDTLDHGQIVRRLEILAYPPIAAGIAAKWTKGNGRLLPPDALVNVWIALDDWVQAGSPPLGGSPNLYGRLITALTQFDTMIRKAIQPPQSPAVKHKGPCGRPMVQGGTDAFCTLPSAHEGACVWGGIR